MQESRCIPAEGMILSGGGAAQLSQTADAAARTVVGWLSGESRKMGAEGESDESRESLRQKDSVEAV